MGKRAIRVKSKEANPELPTEVRCRLRKTPVTFRIQLTPEQKAAKAIALDNDVIIFTGKPGTAKSLLSSNIALDLLISGRVGKIIVTRPMVDVGKNPMGFLPGDAFDFKEGKAAPYIAPILQAMYKLYPKEKIEKLIEVGKIEIVPIQFVRGLNFEDCCVLIDESQNCTLDELKALTTRLCKDAKLILTSDVNQIDLFSKHSSAGFFFKKIKDMKGVCLIELTENFRSDLALAIMDRINDYENDKDKRNNVVESKQGSISTSNGIKDIVVPSLLQTPLLQGEQSCS